MKRIGKKIIFEKESDLPPNAMSLGTTEFNETGSWRNERPVVDKAKCIACGICWKYCPDMSIKEDSEGKAEIDYVFCKGCGICAAECPVKAITMIEEEK